jgi:hypothetical protein
MVMALAPGGWQTESLALSVSWTTNSTTMEAFHIDKDLPDQMDQSMATCKEFFAGIQQITRVDTQGHGPSRKTKGRIPTAILEMVS